MDHKKEVVSMLSILYDQEKVTKNYENEIFNDGMQRYKKGI